MTFLANENFPLVSIRLLRKHHYSVLSVMEQTPGVKDTYVLNWAHQDRLIILTFDRDYGELIYKNQLNIPAGLVYFRFDPLTPEEPADLFLEVLRDGKLPLLGKFTVLERDRVRQRSL